VYNEVADTMPVAIARENQLKRWRGDWKRDLIERENPARTDLALSWRMGPLPTGPR